MGSRALKTEGCLDGPGIRPRIERLSSNGADFHRIEPVLHMLYTDFANGRHSGWCGLVVFETTNGLPCVFRGRAVRVLK